ncbi:TonB-dependent receptor [Hufsiella ginkgonis]|uniref:TonB-dependent receptor plug domain-containing protein n=1 Tax=Hufsiella ginkgonis TaxID=2695274 RepID=A0A7K1Y3K0_9SPHI|nr:TonB-dependent receptor [Hufsiella ginkgonis]MXV17256.1 TonB-dependent receptor plug domain-containing protein [Hufsiella ginkgonis]
MKRLFLLAAACLVCLAASAQTGLSILVKDSKTQEPLAGATVSLPASGRSVSSGSDGKAVLSGIADGKHLIRVLYLGYETKTDSVYLPFTGVLDVLLTASAGENLDEVVISTTRSSRTISAIPTRVEVIAGEELDEKGNMKPGDIRMVLSESTGIQTQQTSATSANASIRIQGLDGRYTQILKDGFPVYSGAASGLGLLQTPPLDLKQVEVIKGSASTLYGGGAIAGLVNLVSKTPRQEPELNVLGNVTSAGGLDLSGYYGKQSGPTGITVFAARNSQAPYAPGPVDLTAIPKFTRYTFNPRLYYKAGDRTTITAGINTNFENRTGGDLHFIKKNGDATHSYFEKNNTKRLSSQFSLSNALSAHRQLTFRNSTSYFNRKIATPGYNFNGSQYGTFTEISYAVRQEKAEWVTGINLVTDRFNENLQTSVALRNYRQTTLGGFIQNSLQVASFFELETGLRSDYVADYGFVLLPRFSALFKLTPKLSSRFGAGLGYKTPTIFTEESERIQYRQVLGISPSANKLERSAGVNWDVNFRTAITDDLGVSINQLFFYTRLNNPLIMQTAAGSTFRFENVNGHFDSRGTETNIKITYQDLKLFIGYTFTDARLHTAEADAPNPLTAKHRLNNVLMYEAAEKWKLGLEAYYYSRQLLNDGTTGRPYWITGFMAERLWNKFSLFINFENLTDTRQTRFDSIFTGSLATPVFRDIYAPLDGFVVNGGIKIKL